MPSILVVDDEEAVRSTFHALLAAEGYRVQNAASAKEARERLGGERFDVVLIDLKLRDDSGLSLLRFARSRDPDSSLVMVTGHPDLSTAVEALKQGAYDYLTKPVTRQALLAVVERACERNQLLQEKRRLEKENEEYQRSLERKVAERTQRMRDSERRYRDLFQETRRAYEQLQRAQQRLIRVEKLAAVGELSARIAHEIRNPLGAISNSIGVLRRDLKVDGDDRRLLEVVYEESQRLASIVADFLEYARPRPLMRRPQSVTEILDDLLLLLSQDEQATLRLQIERDYEEGLPLVEIDAAQARAALWNLLVNAVEAMRDGGALRVAARVAIDGERRWLEVEVSDTGEGIESEDREKIFQPFHTTKTDGTGLGLAIVKRILEEHGGRVFFESEPGGGSSFFLRFPLNDARSAAVVFNDQKSYQSESRS